MSLSPCSSAPIGADEVLYRESKFVPPINPTSPYLNTLTSPQTDITSTHQSQTYKNFLAQKYAAESTSDGDSESHSNTVNHLSQSTQNFSNQISNFYPFSPLVSSSSHYDTRNILGESLLESSVDSLQVESSTTEQVSTHSAVFGESSLESLMKSNVANLPIVSTASVSSSSNHSISVVTDHSQVGLVPTSLFDGAVSTDIAVDSTVSTPSTIQSSMASYTFNNFQTSTCNSSMSSVLAYGLSPSYHNNLIQIDNSQPLLSSLASPNIPLDPYLSQSNILDRRDDAALIEHQLMTPVLSSFSNDGHCLLNDNNLSDNFLHEMSSEQQYVEIDASILQEIVVNDSPVLTRAKASLPIEYLYLQEVDGYYSVFARKPLPKRTQFGPPEGVLISIDTELSPDSIACSSKNSIIIFLSSTIILSQSDENTSNWTRFIKPATNAEEQNLELIIKEIEPTEMKLFFIATRNIMANEELKAWYSKDYATSFNIRLLEEQSLSALAGVELDSEGRPNVLASGHKLRNKIAKTQQLTQATHASLTETRESEHDMVSQSVNETQVHEMFDPNATIIIAPSESQKENGNSSLNATDPQGKYEKPNSSSEKPANKARFQCEVCKKYFPRHYSLRRHQVMHSGEKRYKCPMCGMAFNHVYNRNRHIKMHKSQSVETSTSLSDSIKNCENSSKETLKGSENNGLMHLKQEESPVSHVSPDDGQSVQVQTNDQSSPLFDQHSETLSVPVKVVTSSVDSVTSSGLDKVTTAIHNASAGKHFRCSQCYKRFSTEERLEKHSIVHDESARKLVCHSCNRRFLTQSALACHLKNHKISDGEEKRKYDCTLCGQVFDTIHLRRQHVLVHINPETNLYHCPKCAKTFDDFSVIRKHYKSFHSEESFPCSQCHKVFPRQDKLRLHMLCHSDRWEFKCSSCDKQFKRKDKLKEHMQRMHAPDRDIRMAAKMAARLNRMKTPRARKISTKPTQPNYEEFLYKCQQCLFGFKRRGMLVNHLAKRHPDIPYNSIPELNMPIVKTSKDYYCQYCDKVYKSSSKRKAHIIKNHPGQSLPPSNRNKAVTPDSSHNFSATVGSIQIHPHFCSWCHKQYASKAKLMQHQRKKHPEQISQSEGESVKKSPVENASNSSSSITASISVACPITTITPSGSVATTNVFKLNTIISGDKATLTREPIDPHSLAFKHTGHLYKDCNSSQFISTSPTSCQTYSVDGFEVSNQYSSSKSDVSFLSGMSSQSQTTDTQYTVDSQDTSLDDLLNINHIMPAQHNSDNLTNSTTSATSFSNNTLITLLACTVPSNVPTYSNDLSEFSDIITQMASDFSSEKQILGASQTNDGLETTDIMISGDNHWGQVCEEMTIV